MTQQHYRVTLEQAIAHYQAGDLTAKGLLHFYIRIKLKPGWKVRLDAQTVCQELGIGKTAFYNSISRLKAEGSIDWEAPEGILVSISSSFRECGMDSTVAEPQFTIAESESANAEPQFTIAEKESSKPHTDKQSGDPPNSLTNSYQVFINSLSEDERESFLEFGKKKAKQLPKPPVLPIKWIEANYEELRSQWEKQNGIVRSSQNWESDPRRREWLDKIRSLGFAAFIYESGSLDKERKKFYEWANSKNLIWGDEL